MPLAWYNPYPIVPPFDWRLMDSVNLEEEAVLENRDYSLWNKTPLLYNFYLKGKRNIAEGNANGAYRLHHPDQQRGQCRCDRSCQQPPG